MSININVLQLFIIVIIVFLIVGLLVFYFQRSNQPTIDVIKNSHRLLKNLNKQTIKFRSILTEQNPQEMIKLNIAVFKAKNTLTQLYAILSVIDKNDKYYGAINSLLDPLKSAILFAQNTQNNITSVYNQENPKYILQPLNGIQLKLGDILFIITINNNASRLDFVNTYNNVIVPMSVINMNSLPNWTSSLTNLVYKNNTNNTYYYPIYLATQAYQGSFIQPLSTPYQNILNLSSSIANSGFLFCRAVNSSNTVSTFSLSFYQWTGNITSPRIYNFAIDSIPINLSYGTQGNVLPINMSTRSDLILSYINFPLIAKISNNQLISFFTNLAIGIPININASYILLLTWGNGYILSYVNYQQNVNSMSLQILITQGDGWVKITSGYVDSNIVIVSTNYAFSFRVYYSLCCLPCNISL